MPRPGACDPSERLHDIARQTIAHPATSPRMANASIRKRAFMIDTPCANSRSSVHCCVRAISCCGQARSHCPRNNLQRRSLVASDLRWEQSHHQNGTSFGERLDAVAFFCGNVGARYARTIDLSGRYARLPAASVSVPLLWTLSSDRGPCWLARVTRHPLASLRISQSDHFRYG
jgi:hypothetical protein